MNMQTVAAPEAQVVIDFWREAGPHAWFAKNPAFDAQFRSRFLSVHEAAAQGQLDHWLQHRSGALALVILVDQFPRNAFRGTARMYATDVRARQVASHAIATGFDVQTPTELRLFFYLPFAHSEHLVDQDRSVELQGGLGAEHLRHAVGHRGIIARFGRFPHRNALLGRTTSPEEQRFLDAGGFAG